MECMTMCVGEGFNVDTCETHAALPAVVVLPFGEHEDDEGLRLLGIVVPLTVHPVHRLPYQYL